MTDFSPTTRINILSTPQGSLLSRASVAPTLSPIQSRVDALVGATQSKLSDWRTVAALVAAPAVLGPLHRFASSGRAVAAEAILENAPAMSRGLFASSRLGLALSAALMAGSSAMLSGCGGEDFN